MKANSRNVECWAILLIKKQRYKSKNCLLILKTNAADLPKKIYITSSITILEYFCPESKLLTEKENPTNIIENIIQ